MQTGFLTSSSSPTLPTHTSFQLAKASNQFLFGRIRKGKEGVGEEEEEEEEEEEWSWIAC